MIVALTICSANYLAQARTLGDSLREHHPEYHFVIGLVDRLPAELGREYCHACEVVPVEELGIPEFEDMRHRYTLVELNTAVKPFYISYLYGRDPSVNSVVYFDPDILVLSSLRGMEENLRRYNIILTPHCCSYDIENPVFGYELTMLKTGVFNLGFLATSRSRETLVFLKWWHRRLIEYCFYWPGRGLFVDQYWATLAPLFFQGVFIEKNPGYNMCYWNLSERLLSRVDGRYVVNGHDPLAFYHFSSYDPRRSEYVSNRSPAVLLSDHPELEPLFADYRERLIRNDYETLSKVQCVFYPSPPPSPPPPPPPPLPPRAILKRRLKGLARMLLKAIPPVLRRGCRRVGEFLADNA